MTDSLHAPDRPILCPPVRPWFGSIARHGRYCRSLGVSSSFCLLTRWEEPLGSLVVVVAAIQVDAVVVWIFRVQGFDAEGTHEDVADEIQGRNRLIIRINQIMGPVCKVLGDL